ncbi:MAG: carbohydrate ABC transporter permease [Acholeplasmatales bacterium]|nr:carbohydrate ABC transporter permease [Acholeplasmatales bacterium]
MDEIELKQTKTFKKVIALFFTYLFLIVCSLIVLLPFYWMINVSITSVDGFNNASQPLFVSDDILEGVKNYLDVFKNYSALRPIVNTLIFSVLTTAFAIITAILAAFAFARFEFKGKGFVMFIFSTLAILPNEVLIIGNYSTMIEFGLTSTYIGLVFPSVLNIIFVFILYRCFASVNNNIYYASKMDGLSDFNYLRKVLIPMFKPTIIAIIALKFVESWNLYVWPTLVSNEENYKLIGTTIQAMRIGNVDVPVIMAFMVVVTIPVVIMLLVFRNTIYKGIIKALTKDED